MKDMLRPLGIYQILAFCSFLSSKLGKGPILDVNSAKPFGRVHSANSGGVHGREKVKIYLINQIKPSRI